jgi:HEAT repeat protein
MSNFLEQAEVAAQEVDGTRLNQCLQQLVSSDSWVALSSEQQVTQLRQLLPYAITILELGDFQDRWQVAKVFSQLESAAVTAGQSLIVAPLIDILQAEDADWELRWFVARILGDLKDPAVVLALAKLLQTAEDDELMEAAAAALSNLGVSAIQVLHELLQTDGGASRFLAVQALSRIRRSETIPSLLTVVDDSEAPLRATAIEALSSFHDPRVPPVLVKALADPAAQVRCVAIIGLGLRSDLLEKLGLVNLLAPLLWDLNLGVCQQAAIALGRLGTPAAADALMRVLRAPHTPISLQTSVVRALGWAPIVQTLNHFQQALGWVSQPVRLEIIRVMGQIQNPDLRLQATEILLGFLRTAPAALEDNTLKQALALTLGELGSQQALPVLIQLLADPDLGVRLHAIAALKKLDPQAAYRQLNTLLQREDLPPLLQQGITVALQEWQY